MCIYVYVCIYIIYIVYICVYVYMYICICICISISICICIYVYMYIHCVCVYIYIILYIIYIHIYILLYDYIWYPSLGFLNPTISLWIPPSQIAFALPGGCLQSQHWSRPEWTSAAPSAQDSAALRVQKLWVSWLKKKEKHCWEEANFDKLPPKNRSSISWWPLALLAIKLEMDPVHLQTSLPWPSWAKSSRLPGKWTCRTLKDLDLATLAVSHKAAQKFPM